MPAATAPLAGLRLCDEGRFGGKSAGLGELLAGGIPVPDGFAISADAYGAFVGAAGIGGRFERVLAALDADDVAAVGAASDELRAAIARVGLPEALRAEIVERYAELAGTDPPVAVRSSAVGEDGAGATFAGQQETVLWVRGAEELCRAVQRCWASLYSPEAITYRARLGETGSAPAMGVAVQRMVDARGRRRPVHVQPRQRRSERGRDRRELGARGCGRRRRGDSGRVPRQQGDRRDRPQRGQRKAGRVPARPRGRRDGSARRPAGAGGPARASTTPASPGSCESPATSSVTSARTRTSSGRSTATARPTCSSRGP